MMFKRLSSGFLVFVMLSTPASCLADSFQDIFDTLNTVNSAIETGDPNLVDPYAYIRDLEDSALTPLGTDSYTDSYSNEPDPDLTDPEAYAPDTSDPGLTLPPPNNNNNGEPDLTDPYANTPDNSDPELTAPPPKTDPELTSPYAAQLEKQLQDITDEQQKVYVDTINQDGPDKQKALRDREKQKAEARKNEEDSKTNCFSIDGTGKYCDYPGIAKHYQEEIKMADEEYASTIKTINERTAYFTKALASLRAGKR